MDKLWKNNSFNNETGNEATSEPRHDKKKKKNECAPSEDSDQTGHQRSLHCALNG